LWEMSSIQEKANAGNLLGFSFWKSSAILIRMSYWVCGLKQGNLLKAISSPISIL